MRSTIEVNVTCVSAHADDLDQIMESARTALLYADTAVLHADRAAALRAIVGTTGRTDAECRRSLAKSIEDIHAMSAFGGAESVKTIERLLDGHHPLSFVHELREAVRDGHVRLPAHDPLEGIHGVYDFYVVSKQIREEWWPKMMAELRSAVLGGDAFAMLDEATLLLLRDGHALQPRDQVPPLPESGRKIPRAKELGLAEHLIRRVPGTAQLSIPEVVQLRREAAVPLVHFRAALVEAVDEMKELPGTVEFAEEAEDYARRRVDPALDLLAEAIDDASVLRRLGAAVTSWQVAGSSVIGLGLSELASASPAVGLAAASAIAAAGTTSAAHRDVVARRRQNRRNPYMFLRLVSDIR